MEGQPLATLRLAMIVDGMQYAKCYTIEQAAEILAVGKTKVRQLLLDGEIGFIAIGNGKQRQHRVIPDFELEAYMRRGTRRRNKKPALRIKRGTGISRAQREANARADAARDRKRKR